MPNYIDEESFTEIQDKVTSLVDYSSSSGDEENPAVLRKKQRLDDDKTQEDASLRARRDINSEKDNTYFDESDEDYSDDSDSDGNDYDPEASDLRFLKAQRVSYRDVDKYNLPEVYLVIVTGEGRRKKSRCLELLDEIACSRNRFVGLSVETICGFYAKLNKEEAARMKALEGVFEVEQGRRCFYNIA